MTVNFLIIYKSLFIFTYMIILIRFYVPSFFQLSANGSNYGEIDLNGRILKMTSGVSNATSFEMPLDSLSSCVLVNKDDVEVQFAEDETADRDDYNLTQITFHFPLGQDGEDLHGPAASFHKRIEELNVIQAITGDVIVEFTKEQGNFMAPRGKFSIQMLPTSFVMKGPKYTYSIKYSNLNSFYLLQLSPDISAFVIGLDKPIRQGQQKYQNLAMELPAFKESITLNLTPEQEAQFPDLQVSMEDEFRSLVAKVFKAVSGKNVFIPKKYQTVAGSYAMKCVHKTNNGFLFPLTKAFVFIYKPTLIVLFEDIKRVVYKRYSKIAKSANRHFDISFVLKEQAQKKYECKEFLFQNIDRIEFPNLNSYLEDRKIETEFEQNASSKQEDYDDDEGDDEKYERGSDENSSEEDDDYEGGSDEGSDDDESGSGSGSDESEDDRKAGSKRPGAKSGGDAKRSKK